MNHTINTEATEDGKDVFKRNSEGEEKTQGNKNLKNSDEIQRENRTSTEESQEEHIKNTEEIIHIHRSMKRTQKKQTEYRENTEETQKEHDRNTEGM